MVNKKNVLKVDPAFCFQTTLRRTYDDAFSDDNNDEWVFDTTLDRVMVGRGATASPLLEFDLQPVGAHRNWWNVLNRQRFEATSWQRREIALTDNHPCPSTAYRATDCH